MRFQLLSGTSLLLLAALAMPAAADSLSPYVRVTLGLDRTNDTTFADEDCSDVNPSALFGCADGDDGKPIGARGDFGMTTLLGIGAGAELTPWLRVEAEAAARPNLDFEGNANFKRSGKRQPVSGTLSQSELMAFAYLDPLEAMGVQSRLQPFIGLGAGVSRNELAEMRYDFPELTQPRYAVMPGGTAYSFAWAATAGLAYAVDGNITLELAYRYSDLGKAETDAGELFNVTSKGERYIPIAPTEADLVAQSVTVSARFGFSPASSSCHGC